MVGQGKDLSEIAASLGRSEGAVKAKAQKRGLFRLRPNGPLHKARRKWTAAEREQLRMMVANGFSVAAIAAELGRSPNSIDDRIRMGRRYGRE